MLFAGLDVIGDYLTEVNVTSPTGIRELQQAGRHRRSGRTCSILIETRVRTRAKPRPDGPLISRAGHRCEHESRCSLLSMRGTEPAANGEHRPLYAKLPCSRHADQRSRSTTPTPQRLTEATRCSAAAVSATPRPHRPGLVCVGRRRTGPTYQRTRSRAASGAEVSAGTRRRRYERALEILRDLQRRLFRPDGRAARRARGDFMIPVRYSPCSTADPTKQASPPGGRVRPTAAARETDARGRERQRAGAGQARDSAASRREPRYSRNRFGKC